ncbi:MAG TPA: GNAT family N-acetyltransferase [Burkholderiaceae bacterium]|jgi:predicted GNAT family N-acyltransferase|nr:GNAT family N-acetyltransferase [Burkholderiaceae bacterium]
MALIVESLNKSEHNRKAFDCGEAELNEFLQTKAAKHQTQRMSRTFVLIDDAAPADVIGYYTLSNCQIAREAVSANDARQLPLHPVPAILLGRLAVDRRAHGSGLGLLLLMDSIKRCVLVGQQTGVFALVVDAKHDKAKSFYIRYGFTVIEQHPLTLYLPLATALKTLR